MVMPATDNPIPKRVFKIKDRTLVYVLFATLAVLSFITIQGNRDAKVAAQAAQVAAEEARVAAGFTDLLKDCQTPGTECYDYTQKQREQREAVQAAQNYCVVETLLAAPAAPRTIEQVEALKSAYNDCTSSRTPPDPEPPRPDETD